MTCCICGEGAKQEKSLSGIVCRVGSVNANALSKMICEECVRLANASFAKKGRVSYMEFVSK